jgi:hypothetical protein
VSAVQRDAAADAAQRWAIGAWYRLATDVDSSARVRQRWAAQLGIDPLCGGRRRELQQPKPGSAADWLAAAVFAVVAIGVPAAALAAGLGKSLSTAAVIALLAIAPFLVLPLALRFLIGPDHVRRGRQLALGGGAAFLLSVFSREIWAILDLGLAIVLLALALRPQLIDLLPERAKFDWAGARGDGFTAPHGAAFEYPLKPAVVAMLGVPFALRGILSCGQAAWAYSSGSTVLFALLPALGSGFGYMASLAFLASLSRRVQ